PRLPGPSGERRFDTGGCAQRWAVLGLGRPTHWRCRPLRSEAERQRWRGLGLARCGTLALLGTWRPGERRDLRGCPGRGHRRLAGLPRGWLGRSLRPAPDERRSVGVGRGRG